MTRLSLLALVVLAWGCKGTTHGPDGGTAHDGGTSDGGSGSDGGPTGPGSDFCHAYVNAWCMGNLSCCSVVAQKYGGMTECVDAELASCLQRWTGSAFADGRATFDAAAGSALVTETMSAATACRAPAMRYASTQLSHGTLGAGGGCTAVGDDTSPQSACREPLVCAIDPGSGGSTVSCRAAHALDQDCSDGVPCAATLYCDFASSVTMPLCQTKLADGSACIGPDECSGGVCDVSGSCAAASTDDAFCRAPGGGG